MKRLFGYTAAITLLVSSLISMHACKTFDKSANKDIVGQLQDVKWKFVELDGESVADSVNGKVPTMEFRSENNTYGASGGCNGIGGSYTLGSENSLTLSRGMSTMMACPEMKVEQAIGRVIPTVRSYSIAKDKLILKDSLGTTKAILDKIK